jgi:hypothetical protein
MALSPQEQSASQPTAPSPSAAETDQTASPDPTAPTELSETVLPDLPEPVALSLPAG